MFATLDTSTHHMVSAHFPIHLARCPLAPPQPAPSAGDMFATLTNGLYTPTLHRVINSDPSRSRVSIPFFFEPSFEARIAPLPQFVKAGVQPAFRAVRYGSHLESKVLSNFEL